MRTRLTTGMTLLTVVIALGLIAGGIYVVREVAAQSEATVPSMVSYQGVVSVDGVPFDGIGYFKFAIVDGAGTISFWSNDGTSSGGSEPAAAVELVVSQGQFDVLLGDVSLPNMTQELGPSVFEGAERYLRVWFTTDGGSYEQLAPDRRIVSVPYALQAQQADMVDGLHADELGELPSSSMVMGTSPGDAGLIAAGFSFTGATVEPQAWSLRQRMLANHFVYGAAEVGGILYVIGGHSSTGLTVDVYDPVADAWTAGAFLPNQRYNFAVAVVDGVIYVIGGNSAVDGVTPFDTVDAYDPLTDSWAPKAPMPTARGGLAAAVMDGVIYAIGGIVPPEDGAFDTVEAYDPATDSWSAKAPMPMARGLLAAVASEGVIYAIGGHGVSWVTNINEAYDPATDSWSSKAPMHLPRQDLGAAVLDGEIYALGGRLRLWSDALVVEEVYDPVDDTWDVIPSMPVRLMSKTVAVTSGGQIYALAGASYPATQVYTPQPLLYVYRKD